jgi:hypothetical protein
MTSRCIHWKNQIKKLSEKVYMLNLLDKNFKLTLINIVKGFKHDIYRHEVQRQNPLGLSEEQEGKIGLFQRWIPMGRGRA